MANGENNQDRLQRIEQFLLDPDKVIFESIEEFQSAVSELTELLGAVNIADLEALQGQDGITPQRGVDYMTEEDLEAFEQFILSKMPIADVDFLALETSRQFIRDEVAKIPRVKGDKGVPGKDGKNGRNGSPDSGADIVRKIRELGRNQGLKIKDIRGLDNQIKFLGELGTEIEALRDSLNNLSITVPATEGGSGGQVDEVQAGTGISVTGTVVEPIVGLNSATIASLSLADSALQNITNFINAGTNISITGSGTLVSPYVINASGGGGTGTMSTVKSNGTQVGGADIVTLDFSSDFGVSESPDTEINISIQNKTGADDDFVTGTAGTNGNLVQWNSDGDAIDSTITATSVYRSGGTNVAVADGGTGASTESQARTNLGLAIGTNVQAYSANLDSFSSKTAPSGTVVGTSDTQTLTNKKITPRLNSTASYSSALTPDFNTYDVYHATAQDDTLTLNLPSNLYDGASMCIRLEMVNTETFTPNGSYIFAEDNDAPATFETGYTYELIISRSANTKYLITWARFNT